MIHTLPSGMQTHWRRHEVLANNLANASTAGFKQDDLVVAGETTPPIEPSFIMMGMTPIGQHTVTQWTDFSPGPIRDTGRPLDVAIDGSGFFAVQTARGLRYTRAGALTMDRDGYLTAAGGHRLMGASGPIAVSSGRLSISAKGEIQDDGRTVDTIRVVDFPRPYRLQKEGDGLFAPVDPAAQPGAAADYQVVGGAIEGSNVDTVRTMVSMIEMLRSYESAQRAIQSADETERRANDMGESLMIRALFTSQSGMQAQQLVLDTIANNLANANTAGFKKSRVDFQDLLYRTFPAPGTLNAQGITLPNGIQVGHGTRAVATQRMFSQGDFLQTENPLDLVVEDAGFFQVLRPDGTTAYTRAGAFKKDGTGRVVTSDGFPLQPGITVPNDATGITVGTDGTVSVTTPGQTTAQQVGLIQLARFVNPGGMISIGRNLFVPTQASGDAIVANPGVDGMGTLAQGFLEMSNVKVVEEMVAMITSQRAYEANSKAIQTADEMLAMANNMRR